MLGSLVAGLLLTAEGRLASSQAHAEPKGGGGE